MAKFQKADGPIRTKSRLQSMKTMKVTPRSYTTHPKMKRSMSMVKRGGTNVDMKVHA